MLPELNKAQGAFINSFGLLCKRPEYIQFLLMLSGQTLHFVQEKMHKDPQKAKAAILSLEACGLVAPKTPYSNEVMLTTLGQALVDAFLALNRLR